MPSGRIAVTPGSPISHTLPIFPQQPYPRPFPNTLPSLYSNFAGFNRPESSGSNKPVSTSALSFSSAKSGLSSPVGSGRDSSTGGNQYKFSPREREDASFGGESGGSGPPNGKPEQLKGGRASSPPSIHRPASEPFDRPPPRKLQATSNGGDSIAETAVSSPSPSIRFDEPSRMKTEETEAESRNRSFSGDFSSEQSRETLSRLSSQSNPAALRHEAAEGTFFYFIILP